jgi:septum formation topological specificity factor MinE
MDTKEENKESTSMPVLVPNTKEELISNIKEWIKIDNDIAKLKAEIKDRTNKKKMLTTNLVTVMKTNSIDCFDINDGALVYKQTKSKKSITGKTLLAALQNYYKEQPNLAEDLTKHVLDSREEVVKETIKRKINK